jgi:hypothetical protein
MIKKTISCGDKNMQNVILDNKFTNLKDNSKNLFENELSQIEVKNIKCDINVEVDNNSNENIFSEFSNPSLFRFD